MKKILIVDDEAQLVEMMQMKLEASRYAVVTASDGLEGFQKAQVERPDLIILDITMPRMNGYDALVRLKNDPVTRHIPVVMLSALSQTESIFKSQDLKASDYLIKPFDAEDLLKVIQRYAHSP